jgi:serine/threonine-protein kinase
MTMSASRTVVAGRYEVDLRQPLGTGGMATVYRGKDLRARRTVAVKTLRPEYRTDPDSRRRFRQEARLMAFVSHPNLVTVYDLHEELSGSWVVMEYVPGQNLKKLLDQHGPLPPEEVLLLLEQIAGALGHLHARNLVHLDIKPQNLIVTPDGTVKLIDFGLAQPTGPRQEMVGGTAFGTVAYLAPEQASGEPVDAATDVYALGCVVYELLTGLPPFTAPEGAEHKRQLIRAHLEQLPVAPSEVRPDLALPSWVDDVVGWALAKSRQDRYHDVATFARMFRLGIEGQTLPDSQRTSVLPATATEREQTTKRVPRIVFRRSRPEPDERVEPSAAAEDAEAPERPAQSLLRDAWRMGGRAARRTRPIRGALWRLVLIFALGNALLGVVLMAREGPSVLVERFLSVAPGTTTEVAVDRLNLRAGPGVEYEVIDVLDTGQEVEVTGLSESSDGDRWWPVDVQTDSGLIRGWVWDEGLQPNEWTGRLSWMQGIVERGQRLRDGVRGVFDDLRSIGPLGRVSIRWL